MVDRLTFGTAGLRGPLGDGPLCMNVEQVELAAMAIAEWLPEASTVVIGRDARHGSEDFANVTARVLADAGHRPRIFADPVPTPIVAHLVGVTEAAAGVMVTASHNPATDNGYKVYVADGGQLLPDDAAIIEAAMAALAWPTSVNTTRPVDVEVLGATEIETYVRTVSEALETPAQSGVTIAYTALHGVGGELFGEVLERAGHRVHSVTEQHNPDPDFPTASFPNPEEPGTLDLVSSLADQIGADVVLANDPDADRLAVAVRRPAGWERLTGDEIGVLLASYVLESAPRPCTVASSIVSSTMLSKLAAARDTTHESTLTGFKYLARAGSSEVPLVFAYEEALGYSVLPSVRDKDGISAGLAFANLVASLHAAGRTVDDLLAELAAEFEHHATSQVSIRFDGDAAMSQMTAVMADLRGQALESLGRFDVIEVIDLAGEQSSAASSGEPSLPSADVLIFHLDGGRLIVRPSGTEPKLKAYLEVVAPDIESARGDLDALELATRELLGV